MTTQLPEGWNVSDQSRMERNLIGISVPTYDSFTGDNFTTCHLIEIDKAVALAKHILEIVEAMEAQP